MEKEILAKLEPIVTASTAVIMQQALLKEDIERFQKELRKFIMSAVSFYDASTEGFYHGLLLGMSAIMNQHYDLTSNREAGDGRYDIQLKPKNRKLPGFLIEIKSLSKKQSDDADVEVMLEELAMKGLHQIEKKQYYNELKNDGCTKIICLGVAFSGKKCKVVYDSNMQQV